MKKILMMAVVTLFIITGCKESNPAAENAVQTISSAAIEEIIAANKGKVLLLNIFASWCPPCKEETPGFVTFYGAADKGNFELIGLSIDTNKPDLVKFMDKHKVNYPVYHISPSVQRKLMADKVPTTHIYTPDGEYYTTVLGAINEEMLGQIVEKLTQ